MKEILRTHDLSAIAFATALLEGEGITAFELDVHMNALNLGLALVPRRLMVADRHLFLARIVLRDNGLEPSP